MTGEPGPGPLSRPAHPSSPPAERAHSAWRVAGVVLAVVLGVGGLALIAFVVFMAVAMNQWGSNK